MRAAHAFVLASLVPLTAFQAQAGAPDAGAASVAAASKSLETARANLTKAVEKIQPDPPSTADLDAARDAVEALKDAIDFGANREPEDLDYARAALAARKELRTQREYVDGRRAKVHIFNHRRTIDAALATLKEAAKKVEAKEPAQADFDAARAAADALKKTADDGRQFASQDAAFASYLADIDATVTKQKKAFDDRWVALSADKHRALVEEARKNLASSLGALGKGGTDEQFKAADEALSSLTKRLDEGKPLEANPSYKAISEKGRGEVAAGKKKMDELWTATGLARLKAEIEPAYKDLQTAAKYVRQRKPTDDQLAEARTVSIVVRKLVEKFAPEAKRSEAFGQYMETVKGTLNEVEVQLQLRALDAARRDLTLAMRKVEGKAPTEEAFSEANSAILVVEKTLESVNAKDPLMIAPAADARQAIKDSKASVAKVKGDLDAGEVLAKLSAARKDLTAAMRKVEAKAPTEENFSEANSALLVLEKTLETVSSKDPKVIAAAADGRQALKDSKASIAKKKADLGTADALGKLAAARKDLNAAMRKVEARVTNAEAFSEANSALLVLEKTLEGMNAKDSSLAAAIADGKQAVRDSKASIAKRQGELDVAAQLATLATARKDLNAAMRKVEGKAPTDDHFSEANSAVLVLEKTLETMKARDPALSAQVADGKQALRDSKAMINKRRIEVDVELQQGRVEEARKVADKQLDIIAGPTITNAQLAAATDAVKAISTALEAGAALIPKSRDYAAYDREVKKRVNEANGKIARRTVALAGSDGRAVLTEAQAEAKAKLEAARQPGCTDADVAAAAKAVDDYGAKIEGQVALEAQDKGYAAAAERARNAQIGLIELLEVAKQARELRKKTGEAYAAGLAAFEAAEAGKDLRSQKAGYEKALASFKSCKDEGTSMVDQNPMLAKAIVLIDGRNGTPKEVIGLCTQRMGTTEPLIKPLAALIAFDDGPKTAYEKAKSLMEKGKKAEALAQYDECTATGITLAHRNPELKDRSFTVAGTNITLAELNKVCSQQSKALREKK